MLRHLLPLVCLAIPAFAQQAVQAPAQPQRPLPDVSIQFPNNRKPISPKQYKGKVTVIALVSTNCEGCKKTIAILSKCQTDFAARGLQVIGAAIDDNAKYLADRFVQLTHATFPIGFLDHEGVLKIADTKPPVVVPVLIFVDRKSTVRYQVFGRDPIFKQEEKAVPAIIDSLLKFNADPPGGPVRH